MASNWLAKRSLSSDFELQSLKHGINAALIAVVMPLQLTT